MADIANWLTDMGDVLIRGERALPGASEFLNALHEREVSFLVLTNDSIFTRCDLSARLTPFSLDIPEENIRTSAIATATFLAT